MCSPARRTCLFVCLDCYNILKWLSHRKFYFPRATAPSFISKSLSYELCRRPQRNLIVMLAGVIPGTESGLPNSVLGMTGFTCRNKLIQSMNIHFFEKKTTKKRHLFKKDDAVCIGYGIVHGGFIFFWDSVINQNSLNNFNQSFILFNNNEHYQGYREHSHQNIIINIAEIIE